MVRYLALLHNDTSFAGTILSWDDSRIRLFGLLIGAFPEERDPGVTPTASALRLALRAVRDVLAKSGTALHTLSQDIDGQIDLVRADVVAIVGDAWKKVHEPSAGHLATLTNELPTPCQSKLSSRVVRAATMLRVRPVLTYLLRCGRI